MLDRLAELGLGAAAVRAPTAAPSSIAWLALGGATAVALATLYPPLGDDAAVAARILCVIGALRAAPPPSPALDRSPSVTGMPTGRSRAPG